MVLSYDSYTELVQEKQETFTEKYEKLYEKLDAKIDAIARIAWTNNTRRGITEEDSRPLTDEEIEHELLMRRERAKARHITEKRLLQEILDEEKSKVK
jgi:predicted CopG family antitoxin